MPNPWPDSVGVARGAFGGGSVTLTDASGNALVYSTTAEKDFTGFDGTLYISQSDLSTNSVSIMAW